jgi:hypothetical protein
MKKKSCEQQAGSSFEKALFHRFFFKAWTFVRADLSLT